MYSSCWDANGGLFGVLLTDKDVIISHTLNHASIIDGIRLTKASRRFYSTVDDLKVCLESLKSTKSISPRRILICTDGVFSMDGTTAPLPEIMELARKNDAVLIVDDSHAIGVLGRTGRGTMELFGLQPDENFIYTGTLGKALGGASGGFISAARPVISLLRQKSRPYLFSNSVSPPVVGAANFVVSNALKGESIFSERLALLQNNVKYFKTEMVRAGFSVPDGDHAIVPIMIGDAVKSAKMAEFIREYKGEHGDGFFVISFSFPVVPKDSSRIRVIVSALHTKSHLLSLVKAFTEALYTFK